MQKITLPDLGEGIEEAVVSFWHFSVGDSIKKDNDLVELATDKATFNVPAPASGVIKKILHKAGATVRVGDALAELE
jgi:pyruvate/2-oxoglutarate dehydrogenase complex dihydrolipoamide acyltransferase (E2) component